MAVQPFQFNMAYICFLEEIYAYLYSDVHSCLCGTYDNLYVYIHTNNHHLMQRELLIK